MALQDVWQVAYKTLLGLAESYAPAINEVIGESGIQGNQWTLLLPALALDPKEVRPKEFYRRNPYVCLVHFQRRLAALAAQGFLNPVENDAYELTSSGRFLAQQVIDASYIRLAAMAPAPYEDQQRLAHLLWTLVESTQRAPEPLEKLNFDVSRNNDTGENAPPLIRIDQYLTDLAAFRDDAHIAAWRPNDLSGYAWEAFSYVYRGEASAPSELQARLKRRGFEEADYARALKKLAERGWLQESEGRYEVTSEGRRLREAAEETTDRIFFAPWQALQPQEQDELQSLAASLLESIRNQAEAAE